MKKNCHICLIGAFLLGTLFGWVVNELFCGAPEDNRRDRGVRAEIMMRQQMESRMKKGAKMLEQRKEQNTKREDARRKKGRPEGRSDK
jgi:hypothetical protein|tara:strand:- start:424 stop:687 length:264 start_codon:yes stop_codon:yes gene_type:complete